MSGAAHLPGGQRRLRYLVTVRGKDGGDYAGVRRDIFIRYNECTCARATFPCKSGKRGEIAARDGNVIASLVKMDPDSHTSRSPFAYRGLRSAQSLFRTIGKDWIE